jgi:hypothetical protein
VVGHKVPKGMHMACDGVLLLPTGTIISSQLNVFLCNQLIKLLARSITTLVIFRPCLHESPYKYHLVRPAGNASMHVVELPAGPCTIQSFHVIISPQNLVSNWCFVPRTD